MFNIGLPQQQPLNYEGQNLLGNISSGYSAPLPMNYNFNNALQGGAAANPNFNFGLPNYNAQANAQIGNQMHTDALNAMGNSGGGMSLSQGLGMAGQVMGGLQALGNTWLGFQQLKLGKENLAFQKDAFNKNFANQAQSLNTQMADRQSARTAADPMAYASTSDYMRKNALATK